MPPPTATPPECLILDLFGVLVTFDEALVTDRIARRCADPVAAAPQLRDLLSTPALIRRHLSLPALHARLQRELALLAPFEEFRQLWLSPYAEPMPGMRALLRQLQGRCRLVLLSNIDADYWPVVRPCIPELAGFDATMLSFEQQVAKPEAQAFQRAIAAGGVPVQRCLFVDDKAENIEAAATLGLAGHLFRRTSALLALLRERALIDD